MSDSQPTTRTRWPMPIRILYARPRLLISILVGAAVALLLPYTIEQLRGVTRFLVGWDAGVALYLILAFRLIATSPVSQIRRQAKLQDEGGFVILLMTIVSAAASVGAVFAWLELTARSETFIPRSVLFLLATVMLSRGFIHTMFALHYAHEYYAERHGKGGGLIFPHDNAPDYWDFVYLAFSIGTSTEVSDVEIASKRIRRTATAHGIASFFFNVSVIALTVGLVGDAIQT